MCNINQEIVFFSQNENEKEKKKKNKQDGTPSGFPYLKMVVDIFWTSIPVCVV